MVGSIDLQCFTEGTHAHLTRGVGRRRRIAFFAEVALFDLSNGFSLENSTPGILPPTLEPLNDKGIRLRPEAITRSMRLEILRAFRSHGSLREGDIRRSEYRWSDALGGCVWSAGFLCAGDVVPKGVLVIFGHTDLC